MLHHANTQLRALACFGAYHHLQRHFLSPHGATGRFASSAELEQLLQSEHELGDCNGTRRSTTGSESAAAKDAHTQMGSDEGACCSICHDQFSDALVGSVSGGFLRSSKRAVVLDCGHIFCRGCLEEWLRREKTCPLCRGNVEDAGPGPGESSSGLSINLF